MAEEERTPLRRVVMASLIGTTIEWYDFFLYGSAAALVFNRLFFPEYDPLVGTLLAFATYAVGFVARPLGGIVCGHYGDRVGRKAMLVITLMLMGLSTAAIGLLPTYATIGVWAPVLLTLLRFVPGFSFGGELGGAALLTVEHAPRERRGFWGSIPFVGSLVGQGVSTAVLLAAAVTMSDEAFVAWGWRIAFVFSLVMVAVGLFIRLKVIESPVFRTVQRERRVAHRPLVDALRAHGRQLVLNTGLHFGVTVAFFVNSVFVVSYVTTTLELSRTMILLAVILAQVVFVGVQIGAGALSDRVGRRPVYTAGALWIAAMAVPYVLLLDTREPALIWIALILLGTGVYLMYGPQPAFFTELFPAAVRYTAFSLPVAVATILGGSTAPIVATTLVEWGSGTTWLVSAYLVLTGLVTAVCALLTHETAPRRAEPPAPSPRTGRFSRAEGGVTVSDRQ